MKEYSSSEVFKVSIASGIANEGLYLGVVSFTAGIGYWIQSVTEQSFEMLLKHVGYLRKRFEFKTADPSPPVIEEDPGLSRTTELPELSKCLFGRPGLRDLQVKLFDHIKLFLVILSPVLRSSKEQVFGSLQPVFALVGQFLTLGSSYFVHRLIEVFGDVKTVMHNLRDCA